MQKQRQAQIPVLSWLLSLLTILIAASAIYIEQSVFDPSLNPWLKWALRGGLVLVAFLGSWMLVKTNTRDPVPTQLLASDPRAITIKSLVDITVDIVSELDEVKVLKNISQHAADLIGASFGGVLLYNKDLETITVAAHTPSHLNLIGNTFEKAHGISGLVVETGRPVIISRYSQWDHRVSFDVSPYDTFLAIPLKWKNEIIGSLTLGDVANRRHFAETDISLLQPFADLASIAIVNSRMYSQVIQITEDLAQRNQEKSTQLELTREELFQKTVQLQGLLKRLTNVQEAERARISHDMHDSTTQLILAAVFGTQAAIEGMRSHPDQSCVQLKTVQMLLHQIEIEIREAIRNLRPIILDQEGAPVALKQYIERVTALSNLKSSFQVTGTPIRFPEEIEVVIYRIVQEALQNITAHAHATHVSLDIQFLEDRMKITVKDDGVGFKVVEANPKDSLHYGLAGMRERAEAIGASVDIQSQPGQGTCVELVLPYPKNQNEPEGQTDG